MEKLIKVLGFVVLLPIVIILDLCKASKKNPYR